MNANETVTSDQQQTLMRHNASIKKTKTTKGAITLIWYVFTRYTLKKKQRQAVEKKQDTPGHLRQRKDGTQLNKYTIITIQNNDKVNHAKITNK